MFNFYIQDNHAENQATDTAGIARTNAAGVTIINESELSHLEHFDDRKIFTKYRSFWRSNNNQEVLLKKAPILFKQNTYGEEARQLFEDNAKRCLLFKHPNLVGLYGILSIGEGKYYNGFVWEFVKNAVSLRDFLNNSDYSVESLPWSKRLVIVLDIVAGLLYLHKNDVIHNNLNDCNVLLDEKGHAKLSDFSDHLKKRRNYETPNTTRRTIFMSLENYPLSSKSSYPASKTSDIYALGWLLWEIASCKLPDVVFLREKLPVNNCGLNEPFFIFCSTMNGTRNPRPENISDDYWQLIEGCWARARTRRPKITKVQERVLQMCSFFLAETTTSSSSQQSSSSVGISEQKSILKK